MDVRNLTRLLVVNKALKKFQKKHDIKVKYSDVCILLSLYRGYNSTISIREYLAGFYRSYPFNYIQEALANYVALGWVGRAGIKYTLTLEGINAIGELEVMVRDMRSDR